MYSIEYRFLFIHVPKTGGNAIQQALLPFAEDRLTTNQPFQDGVHRFGVSNPVKLAKHASLAEYHAIFGEDRIRKLVKFSCIRNPWERVISYYFSPHWGKVHWDREKFIEILYSIHPLEYFIKLDSEDDRPLMADIDFLVRFECLEADFLRVVRGFGFKPPRLKKLNSSKRNDYHHYYDSELIWMVEERFRREIELGGYAFEL